MIVLSFFSIATCFTCGVQTIRGCFGSREVFPCSRFLFIALCTYKHFRQGFPWLLLYPDLLIFVMTCLTESAQLVRLAFIGIEKFGCRSKCLLATRAPFVTFWNRWMFGRFRNILFFSVLENAGLTPRCLDTIEVGERFDLLALCAVFGYNAIHGRTNLLSSRLGMLAHRSGINIYYPNYTTKWLYRLVCGIFMA
jgi:hypothetical protein